MYKILTYKQLNYPRTLNTTSMKLNICRRLSFNGKYIESLMVFFVINHFLFLHPK